ncbi:MAG TPA: hypothetical protein VFF70_11925, partial [Anaerolineae bacterium]|nr:hypothetical protein [Anaerolineae bacterium]
IAARGSMRCFVGETNQIEIGERTNVQDGAIIHVDTCRPYLISSSVTIGHASEVHRAVVDDDVLIGIGAKILSGARIGRECILGAGTLITGRTVLLPMSLVIGLPGRLV